MNVSTNMTEQLKAQDRRTLQSTYTLLVRTTGEFRRRWPWPPSTGRSRAAGETEHGLQTILCFLCRRGQME